MERHQEYRRFRANHPEHCLHVAGKCWRYISAGAGEETMLLLPGGFGVADTSFRLIAAFSNMYRVISLSYPTDISTARELVDGIAGVLAHEGISGAHVLGGSASGLVAQCLVRRHPNLVRSLVLSHTGVPQPGRARWMAPALALLGMLPFRLVRAMLHATIWSFLPARTDEHAFWRGYFRDRIDELSREALHNRFRVLIDLDRSARFSPTDLQVWPNMLIVAVENDGFVSKREHAALMRLYPHARCHLFQQGTHRDSVTEPEAEIAIIRDFLAANSQSMFENSRQGYAAR